MRKLTLKSYSRYPTTDRFCVICGRDIKDTCAYRQVHLIEGGATILHPDDEMEYVSDNSDLGVMPIGMGCARSIGFEWSFK